MNKAVILDFQGVLYSPSGSSYPNALNEELLDFLRTIHNEIYLYIFTKEILLLESEIEKIRNQFDGVFIAKDLGIAKNDPRAYKLLAEKIGADPSELIYIDDSQENITAADTAGINAWLYTENSEIMRKLNRLF